MPKQGEADETRSRAPLEYALLTRHAKVVKQRQVFDTERTASAVEMITVIDVNIAVCCTPPRFKAPQSGFYDAPFKSLEEARQAVSPVVQRCPDPVRPLVLPTAPNCATLGQLGNCAVL